MWGSWKSKVNIFLFLLSTLLLTTIIAAEKQKQLHHSKNHNHHHNNHHQHLNHKRLKQQLQQQHQKPEHVRNMLLYKAEKNRSLSPINVTTRLQPLNMRDYNNNKVLQRRPHHQQQPRRAQQTNEWDDDAYNVQSNSFMNNNNNNNNNYYGNAISPRAGKGEDNSQDVEFISVTGATIPKWPVYTYNTRRYSTSTTTTSPPALVPARRGYSISISSTQSPITSQNDAISTPITEGPLETNTKASRSHPPYDSAEMERRHICVQQRVITMPVKTTEIYRRPIQTHVSAPCQFPAQNNQRCTRVKWVYEHAYRDVTRNISEQSVTYDCCTGWTRESPLAESCLKPICSTRCQNGGTCTGPDSCSCILGYSGRHCELDINECQEYKPCDQTCINTMGSYHCRCREGFVLQADRQSCKKIPIGDEDAFEARDMENEIDMGAEDVSARLSKIERSLANERVQTNELKRSLQSTYNVVDTLKMRLGTLEKQHMDVNRLQSNLYATETRTNKLEGLLNLFIKCRNGPNANCP